MGERFDAGRGIVINQNIVDTEAWACEKIQVNRAGDVDRPVQRSFERGLNAGTQAVRAKEWRQHAGHNHGCESDEKRAAQVLHGRCVFCRCPSNSA